MNKVKLLSVLAIILLITNLISLAFILSTKPGRREGPKDYIIKQLNFDKDQTTAYQKLIFNHRMNIRNADEKIYRLKGELYGFLNLHSETEKDSLIAEIAKAQIEVENTHCKHFIAIKNLCKPSQIEAYNALLLEMSDLFSPYKKPKK
jgi:hypothetical protein